MTALEEIKKALEGVRHSKWFMSPWHAEEDAAAVRNQDDGSYICNATSDEFAKYIASVNPPDISELLSSLESLQRENEELRQDRDRTARNRDMWKGQVERQADSLSKFREEEIRLRETLFQCGSFIADRYQEGDAEYQVVLLVNDAICSKPALASTGGSNDPRNI